MTDDVVIDSSFVPPVPHDNPSVELKRTHTSEELRDKLNLYNLSARGSKSDLSLRLVKRESGLLTVDDVFNEYTVAQLRKRLAGMKESTQGNKLELSKRLFSLM